MIQASYSYSHSGSPSHYSHFPYGQKFYSEETDLVFKNRNSLKFKFGFELELGKFSPGYLDEDGMCSYQDVQKNDEYFAAAVYHHPYSVVLWKELTASLAKFHKNYEYYREQCTRF